MEIDDEIEQEIDVIYSGEFGNEITLMQFPLIPNKSFNESSINSLSISSDNNQMILEKNLDINYLDSKSPNFSGTDILKGLKIEPETNQMMGVFKDNKLYLSPCTNIYQFKHDFSYFEDDKKEIQIKKKDIKKKDNLIQQSYNDKDNFIKQILFNSNSIESYSKIDKITNDSKVNIVNNSLFLSQDDYKNLLMKYINDKSITDILNEKAIPSDWEEHPMMIKKKEITKTFQFI